MIKALQLIFAPGTTWQKIVETRRGIAFISMVFLLPLMILSCTVEGYSLWHWGKAEVTFGHRMGFATNAVITFEAAQLIAGMLVVVIGAQVVLWLGTSFQFRPRYSQCFTVAAYGLSPIFLARFLNVVPAMNPWVSWAIGITGCIYVLYQGVGLVLQPESTQGMGLYMLSGLVFFMLSGLAQLIALTILRRGGLTF